LAIGKGMGMAMAMGMGLWSRVTTKRSWLDCIEVDRANWFLAVDVDKLCSINSEGRGIGFLFFFFLHIVHMLGT